MTITGHGGASIGAEPRAEAPQGMSREEINSALGRRNLGLDEQDYVVYKWKGQDGLIHPARAVYTEGHIFMSASSPVGSVGKYNPLTETLHAEDLSNICAREGIPYSLSSTPHDIAYLADMAQRINKLVDILKSQSAGGRR